MITLSLKLTALKHALMTTPKGAKVIVIPIEDNNLWTSEKTPGVYGINIVGFEFEDKTGKQYPDTHLLKQSYSKAELEAMTEEQKKALPILGNARVSGGGERGEAPPQDLNAGKVATGLDDLTF
jgi:hypothetical protein